MRVPQRKRKANEGRVSSMKLLPQMKRHLDTVHSEKSLHERATALEFILRKNTFDFSTSSTDTNNRNQMDDFIHLIKMYFKK